jgi:hypothetical protein
MSSDESDVIFGSVSCLFAFALLAHSLLPRERQHAAVFLLCVLDKLMEISAQALSFISISSSVLVGDVKN